MAPANEAPIAAGSLLDGPAGIPPAGTVPDLEDPPNKNELVRAVTILTLVITTLFMVLRIHSRVLLKRFKVPDFLGLAAFALYIAFAYEFFKLDNSYGWFVHMWDLRLRDFPGVNQIFYQGLIIYFCILLLIKSAILLEWTSIFVPTGARNTFFWLSTSILTVHVLFYFSIIIVELTACKPFERNWNPLIGGKCLDTVGIAVAISAINLTFDIVIFLLPQKVIWTLNVRPQKKIGISALFAVGILACLAGGFRLGASLQFYKSKDVSYTFSTLALWCLAEATCGFIIFCGPAMPRALSGTELSGLVTNLKSWAGSSVRKLVSSGSSNKDLSFPAIRRRSRSGSSLSRHENSPEKSKSPPVPPVPSVPREYDSGDTRVVRKGGIRTQEGTILQTTRFTAIEDRSDQDIAHDQRSRQHPWMSSSEGM